MRALVPHLEQALHTQSKLVELARERAFAFATLEKAQYGILIVAEDATLMFANSMAEEITLDIDGLAVDSFGRLRATPPAKHMQLCRLIREAAAPAGAGGTIAVARRSGKRALTVHVTPLDGMAGGLPWHRAALLLVVDPDHDPGPQSEVLQELYELTEAETMVAKGVLHGEGLPAVADQLSVSLATARTHLQHIFIKTGTHRQAELVRLLLTVANAAQ
ncbi:helix-turn-helix transcriptional regulator [Nocardia sp. NPDC059228]|uniref:helix-turn-helix transcriptional regulator n=1 Tax=Nocardia sp. NPDC059228 TaxID=3346777 RepID=UPI0036B156D9